MSFENAISDHAAAIRELAAAIRATVTGAAVTGAADTVQKTVDKKETVAPVKKTPPAEKPPAATGKPGADPKANSGASLIDYAAVIKPKILELAKMPEGRDKLTALLQRFGVTKGPDLKPEQHVEFDETIDRVIAGEYDPRDAEPTGEEGDDVA